MPLRHIALCLLLLVTGCAVNTSKAVRIDAYDPHGNSSTTMDEQAVTRMASKHGIIFEFEPGDEIILKLGNIDTDLVKKVDDQTLRVERPFYVLFTRGDVRFSTDPTDFRDHRVRGSLSLGFGMDTKSKQNAITFTARSSPAE